MICNKITCLLNGVATSRLWSLTLAGLTGCEIGGVVCAFFVCLFGFRFEQHESDLSSKAQSISLETRPTSKKEEINWMSSGKDGQTTVKQWLDVLHARVSY